MQNTIIKNFDRIASNYIEAAIIQKKIAHILFKNYEFINNDSNKMLILDLGSGPGTFLHFDNHVYDNLLNSFDIINFDISFNMLAQNANNSIFKLNADISNIPIINNSIDIIISNLAIQWFDNKKSIFESLRTILKRGGSIIISTLINNSFHELNNAYNKINVNRDILVLDKVHQYEKYCKEANLKIQKLLVWDEVVYFEKITDLFLHFKASGTKISQIDSNGLYGRRLINKLDNVYIKNNNLFPLTYKCLILYLTYE